MKDLIDEHHRLEAELHWLRLARDLGDPGFRPETEDEVLDEMEAVWHRLAPEDRRMLEAECAARAVLSAPLSVRPGGLPAVDVDDDDHLRRAFPPRVAGGAAA
jgi:hypothetical protein